MTRQYKTGSQLRTIFCPCGWSIRSQLRESNSRFSYHQKICPQTVQTIPAFSITKGSKDVIKMENGNIGQVSLVRLPV